MANPQLHKGFTRIANEILGSIARSNLNGTQVKILLILWRYTYGFGRKDHELTLSFLAESLNTTKSHIDRELTALIERNIIKVVGVGERRGRVLAYNKYYDEWLEEKPKDDIKKTEKQQVKKSKNNKSPNKKYDEDNTYYKMAHYFFDKVSAVAKDAGVEHLIRKANLQSWADDFRKLVELDGVDDKKLILAVMDWVTQDLFWRTNILSARSLRAKFAELAIKMKSSQTPKQPVQQQPKNDIRDKEIEFQKFIADGGDPDAFDWGK